jgi:serine/threonine protein kinase
MSLQNRYKIIQVLRRGGMATVYLALDQRLNCEVALKEISFPEDIKESSKNMMLLAFEQEAQFLAGLNHPAFPRSRDYFVENDNHFLVMDFIGGIDLERLLQRNHGELGVEQIKDWTFQILDALEYLHGQKPIIIHRDIKPSNIKLNTKNQIRLLDFGIAKTLETGAKTDGSINFATLEYAPLEQSLKASAQIKNSLMAVNRKKTTDFLEFKSSPASDIFALGATLYRLLTGHLPVDAHSRALAIWLGKGDPLPSVSCLSPTVPPKLESVIMQSLNLFPLLRPQSVADFRQQLLGTWKEKAPLTAFCESFQVPNPRSQPHLSALIRHHQELLKKVRGLEQAILSH